MSSAIRLRSVRRAYGKTAAVDGVSLDIPAGRTTALLGPSGSGKSTLLRLIAGLEPLDGGEIAFDADIVSQVGFSVAPETRRVGVVFQDYALFPHLSAAENVAFGLTGERAARRAAALAWLDRVGLAPRADAYPHMLSGGEQQRVALARALAPNPRAVLLDEPFSGLDPVLREDLRATTLQALSDSGATAVFVTHDAEEALAVADQLAILRGGRLLQAGAPRAVYDSPNTLHAAAALGPVNVAQGVVRGGAVDTPFGAIAAPGLAEGASGQVVVRAEAVRIAAGSGATLIDRRPQGAMDWGVVEAGGLRWRGLMERVGGPGPGESAAVGVAPAGWDVLSAAVRFAPEGCYVFSA